MSRGRSRAAVVALLLAPLLALPGCGWLARSKPGDQPPQPTKGWSILDTVFQVTARTSPPPEGYGLYTVLLTRSADTNTLKLVSELFKTTVSADDAALPANRLNLLTLPVKDRADATRTLAAAREQPDATAAAFITRHYDHGQAALLLASVCAPERGPAIAAVCGARLPDGPLLVTSPRPFDRRLEPGQQLLVVNLGQASPAAVAEMWASYRRQVLRKDFRDRVDIDSWRLAMLTGILNAAQLLPGISKAYAAGR